MNATHQKTYRVSLRTAPRLWRGGVATSYQQNSVEVVVCRMLAKG